MRTLIPGNGVMHNTSGNIRDIGGFRVLSDYGQFHLEIVNEKNDTVWRITVTRETLVNLARAINSDGIINPNK